MVCPEYLFTFQYGIYFRKNSFLQSIFNDKISILKSSGLIDFWARDFINSAFLNIKLQDASPRKLNISQLKGGFEVLLIGYGLGSFILLCEVMAKRLRFKMLQNVIEFFTSDVRAH